jgi:hypothetical protein
MTNKTICERDLNVLSYSHAQMKDNVFLSMKRSKGL